MDRCYHSFSLHTHRQYHDSGGCYIFWERAVSAVKSMVVPQTRLHAWRRDTLVVLLSIACVLLKLKTRGIMWSMVICHACPCGPCIEYPLYIYKINTRLGIFIVRNLLTGSASGWKILYSFLSHPSEVVS